MSFIRFLKPEEIAEMEQKEAQGTGPIGPSLFSTLVGIIMGIGITVPFMGIGGYFIYQDHIKQTTWNDVPAHVIASEVVENRDSKGVMYQPLIKYEYELNDHKYMGVRDSVSDGSYSSPAKIVRENPVGKEIMVKVNPLDDGDSYTPGDLWFWWIFFGGGLLFFLVFVLAESVTLKGYFDARRAITSDPHQPSNPSIS